MSEVTTEQALAVAFDHHKAGRLLEAEQIYRQIIAADPQHGPAWQYLGILSHKAGNFEQAERIYRHLITLHPSWANAYIHLGATLLATGRVSAALETYRAGIDTAPTAAGLYYALGSVLQQSGAMHDSIAPLERAVALKPNYPEAYTNLGNAYRAVGRLGDAVTVLRRAVMLAPELAEAHFNLGVVLQALGEWSEARAAYDQAVALRAQFAEAHLNRAILALMHGDFERGLHEHEWRTRFFPPAAHAIGKAWENQGAAGKSVLVEMEQGYGDAIQFVRYVPLLASRGAKVIVRVESALVELFQTLAPAPAPAPAATVISRVEPLPAFDLHVWMLSLPLRLGTRMETIPAPAPYLRADPARVERWRGRMDASGFKVGLCWAASALNPDTRAKSIPAGNLARLAGLAGVQWFSLDKNGGERPAGLELIDWTAELRDFADTAALVECLDLVISVDTAVSHLAGALAKRVWTLLPYSPDWRWFLGRGDSPWYPTMRLFRQPAKDDWESVLDAVRAELERR